MKRFNFPKNIYLYKEGIVEADFGELKHFIGQTFGNVKVCVVKLEKKAVHVRGLLFDFIATQKAFEELKQSINKDACHIIFTSRLFVTLDEQKRPHIRAGIFGYPSVISTSGIVEGPAKPREYYLYKQKYSRLGVWDIYQQKIKEKFKGRFIDYADTRLTEVIKGYIAQAIFFYIIGEPFCEKRNCRLFNAHWQEDLINAQIKKGSFCKEHRNILNETVSKTGGGYAVY